VTVTLADLAAQGARAGAHPFPIILSAPSGGGKTTIARRLLAERADVGYSVSCTTRAPRAGEVHGRDYFFLSAAEFEAARDRGDFAEWAPVHGNLYGTLRREVDGVLAAGRHVLMDIDIEGARQFMRAFPASVGIFVLPPSGDVLLSRLNGRASESAESMAVRVRNARDEVAAAREYEYVVVNDDLARAVAQVASIVDAEGSRRERLAALDARVRDIVAALDAALAGAEAAADRPCGRQRSRTIDSRPTSGRRPPARLHRRHDHAGVHAERDRRARDQQVPRRARRGQVRAAAQRVPAHPRPLGREEADHARARGAVGRQHRLRGGAAPPAAEG
jgi:guanylate kinase